MRIISETIVKGWVRRHADAAASLHGWLSVAKVSDWTSLADVRRTFPHADPVTTGSGRTAMVFNIAGNKYRLITAVHYNTGVVFTLSFLTHATYSKNRWKDKL